MLKSHFLSLSQTVGGTLTNSRGNYVHDLAALVPHWDFSNILILRLVMTGSLLLQLGHTYDLVVIPGHTYDLVNIYGHTYED